MAGSDYDAVAMGATLTPSLTEACIQINIIGDSLPESDETFDVQISTDNSQAILNPDRITINIRGMIIILKLWYI